MSRLEVHLSLEREASAAAYLRAAHAYMLISMPTGTSTILGVFQAIWLSLFNRTNFALPSKLMPFKKFASEIFWLSYLLQCKTEFTFLCERGAKPKTDQRVQSPPH